MGRNPRTVALPASTTIITDLLIFLIVCLRARRIKCDEQRPTCLRCARSLRVCEGYRETERGNTPAAIPHTKDLRVDAHSNHEVTIESCLHRALRTGCSQSEQQHRLSRLGTHLLTFDSFGSFGASGVFLDSLIPQLCHTTPSVHAVAMALGAAYELQTSSDSSSSLDKTFVASLYQTSLRATSRDLAKQQYGPIPFMMMCIMLCLTEVFLQQEPNALLHLQCAFKLLQDRRDTRLASCPAQFNNKIDPFPPEDDIEIVFRTLDFHTCSYALSKTPYLPAIPLPPVLQSITDLSSANITLVQLVHACYEFTSMAYKWKYRPSASPPMSIQQGRLIAHLLTWLEQFNLIVLPTPPREDTNSSQVNLYCKALTLRMTALSTLIYLSCILCPLETAYDNHASHFQQIITDGEVILTYRHKVLESLIEGACNPRFANGPGLIQPLFQSALKYRHPVHRRHAIALLSLAGREGPWCGPREARIASRIMELEEAGASDSLVALSGAQSGCPQTGAGALRTASAGPDPTLESVTGPDRSKSGLTTRTIGTRAVNSGRLIMGSQERTFRWAKSINLADIVESVRIKSMGMEPATEDAQRSNRTIVRIFRCWDMEALLTYPCGHGLGQSLDMESHLEGPCKDNPNWVMQQEVLEF